MSSTSLAVSSDSSRPTSAIARAYGAMISSVVRLKGTSGISSEGSVSGRSPSSPTSGSAQPAASAAAVTATMTTSGAGTAVVTRGSSTMTATPKATSG